MRASTLTSRWHCSALDTLPELRQQIAALEMAPRDSVRAFTLIIGRLLAVGFEVGDIAADPTVSRALVALVNLAQAKEYAGQERATVGAALSSGRLDAADRQRMQQLIAAQDEALRIFAEFSDQAHTEAFNDTLTSRDSLAVERMRRSINLAALDAPRRYRRTPGINTRLGASMHCTPLKMRCRTNSASCAVSN